MATKPEDIGILTVHGIGEQQPLYHLRRTVAELKEAISRSPSVSRVSEIDHTAGGIPCIILTATVRDRQGERLVRLHVREVFWADLGANGPLPAQLRFWVWGLGQWAARIVFKGRKLGNTTNLMVMPRFGYQASPDDPPNFWHRVPSRAMLLAAALLAFLLAFTWTAVKELMFRAFKAFPRPSLIYRYIGDTMIYERGYNPASGEDARLPRRATIRRRMIGGVTAMASENFDRWYIFAHSLGCVPAFNALQETEIALPNYLSLAEWQGLRADLKSTSPFVPKGKTATTRRMMPHRPKWLQDSDGIDRKALFARFAGFVTYGCPLDKFAALWPRIVCLNRQTQVFPPGCEWVNFHDATDPVAARIDAFDPPPHDPAEQPTDRIALKPMNVACRAGPLFLLSHIQYFAAWRKRPTKTAIAIAQALLSNGQISIAQAASAAHIRKGAILLRLLLACLTAVLAGVLMLASGAAVAFYVGDRAWDLDLRYTEYVQLILVAGGLTILGAGVLRTGADYLTRDKL